MRRFLLFLSMAVVVMMTNSCYYEDECLQCEIYDYYGNYVEYYGSECGDSYDQDYFMTQADDYAWYNYSGYAECYHN